DHPDGQLFIPFGQETIPEETPDIKPLVEEIQVESYRRRNRERRESRKPRREEIPSDRDLQASRRKVGRLYDRRMDKRRCHPVISLYMNSWSKRYSLADTALNYIGLLYQIEANIYYYHARRITVNLRSIPSH
ncbi:MAG: hypothetical protein LBD89_00940, partial [Tannerellaceae bacterium]|nr:hypothetical protein [Tannerellaceae bacterium]